MISHTSKLLVLISIIFVEARGRYEYIEESDLPAFYSWVLENLSVNNEVMKRCFLTPN